MQNERTLRVSTVGSMLVTYLEEIFPDFPLRGYDTIELVVRPIPHAQESLWKNDYSADAESVLDQLKSREKHGEASEASLALSLRISADRITAACAQLCQEGRIIRSPGGVFWKRVIAKDEENATPSAHIGA